MLFNYLLTKFIFPPEVLAHCPLCVAGAGVGLSLSRLLGIDDSITGLWIAALLGASALWLNNILKKKFIPLQKEIIYLFTFASTIWSFGKFGLINMHAGLIMGSPKVIFGMTTGGVIFYLADIASALIKKIKGRVLFPYQGVILSIGSMAVASILMFILINYLI